MNNRQLTLAKLINILELIAKSIKIKRMNEELHRLTTQNNSEKRYM
jgi:hypothetical protein